MSRAIVLSSTKIALLITAASLAGYLLGKITTTKSNGSRAPSNHSGSAFVLLINLKFTTLDHRDNFFKIIKPLCKDMVENEPTTLSYQVAISDKDPLVVNLLERYADKDNAYLTVHKSGAEFLKFREQLKEMQEKGYVVIVGDSYVETDLGYV